MIGAVAARTASPIQKCLLSTTFATKETDISTRNSTRWKPLRKSRYLSAGKTAVVRTMTSKIKPTMPVSDRNLNPDIVGSEMSPSSGLKAQHECGRTHAGDRMLLEHLQASGPDGRASRERLK